MSLINIKNLTFSYEGSFDNIFENVSFMIDTDWKLGFTGRNGRGKTTFLRLLCGELEYSGSITYDSKTIQFEYFPYYVKDKNQFVIDIIREISCNAEDWQLQRELSLLDINSEILWREFETLSQGEQTKVLIAGMFLRENSFLLIDEPTNHLDAEARQKLANYLNKKSGYILVSHDRSFLDGCIDHVLSINKTNIEIQKCDFSAWLKNKQANDSFEIAKNQRLKKDISKLHESAKRLSEYSDKAESTKLGTRTGGLRPDRGFIGHKAAKMMQRSKNAANRREKMIEEKSSLMKNIEADDMILLNCEKFHIERLVSLKNISIKYENNTVCSGVTFDINRGERIALRGRNGCGKSSIIKLILGQKIQYSGDLIKNNQLIISYVSQNFIDFDGNLHEFSEEYNTDETRLKTMLRKLGFERSQFDKNISNFSLGQKKKVMLAKSMCDSAHLYIWDEPLNYIDVISRIQIENMLSASQATILFVEHDASFVNNAATKIIDLGGQ